MRTRAELAVATITFARDVLRRNIKYVTLDEALQAGGGHRSILGIFKHTAAWSHIYRSYAFDAQPKHWAQTAWPRGLMDTIETTQDYFDDIVAWLDQSCDAWVSDLKAVPDEAFDQPRPCHWGGAMPLFDIVLMISNHWGYHTGEINAVLSIIRGQAWEYTEEVEENHISTIGHRIRPEWMSEEQVAKYEVSMAKRDAQIRDRSS